MRASPQVRPLGMGWLNWIGLFVIALWAPMVQAERVALVIGNANYRNTTVLDNPHNDAREVAVALQRLGFEVGDPVLDVDKTGLENALKDFAPRAARAEQAVVFFAGHGVEANGENFLVPVDASLKDESTVGLEAVTLSQVMAVVARARELGLVILDACRDNPMAERMSRTDPTRSGYRGLRPVEPVGNVLVAYAAKAEQKALDGKGARHSPYTAALLETLNGPPRDVRLLFGAVRDLVLARTNRKQDPATYGLMGGKEVFLGRSGTGPAPPAPGPAVDPLAVEVEYWRGVQGLGTLEAYRDYLARYPRGQFVRLAEGQIARLTVPPRPEPEPAPVSRVALPAMVEVPAGSFQMGSPSYEEGEADERPVRGVRIKAFRLGKFEVTRGEFGRFVSATGYRTDAERNTAVGGSAAEGCFAYKGGTDFDWKAGTSWRDPGFEQGDDHPVVCVSWNDAKAYIDWLNGETGRRYRLPSEAEQEYAIRAGSRSPYAWGSDANGACAHANVADASAKGRFSGWTTVSCNDGSVFTRSVGRYEANRFGLHDTVGNVWEWGQDCYRGSYQDAPVDGSAVEASGCEGRVLRGAAWDNVPAWLRSADRNGDLPAFRSNFIGFRLAEDL